jgi:ATP-dependent DNA helicase RecG
MNLRELRRLCRRGESDILEFKRTTGTLPKAMQTLCAFLNSHGGRVVFGVTDEGDVRGQHVGKATLANVTDAFRLFWPRAAVRVERFPLRDGKQVVVLSVERGPDGPYTFDGIAYRRVGATTRRLRIADSGLRNETPRRARWHLAPESTVRPRTRAARRLRESP